MSIQSEGPIQQVYCNVMLVQKTKLILIFYTWDIGAVKKLLLDLQLQHAKVLTLGQGRECLCLAER